MGVWILCNRVECAKEAAADLARAADYTHYSTEVSAETRNAYATISRMAGE